MVRSYWEERADRIGPETGRFVREVFDSDDVLHMLRPVQAIVTHLERHRLRGLSQDEPADLYEIVRLRYERGSTVPVWSASGGLAPDRVGAPLGYPRAISG